MIAIDRCQKFMRQLGWSYGDTATAGRWLVYAHRGEQRVIVRADSQSEAWNEALRQTRIVQQYVY